jgi:hypothetical protein
MWRPAQQPEDLRSTMSLLLQFRQQIDYLLNDVFDCERAVDKEEEVTA